MIWATCILWTEYAGVELEGPIPEEIKKHLDEHGGHRERIVSHIPDFATEMKAMNNRGEYVVFFVTYNCAMEFPCQFHRK